MARRLASTNAISAAFLTTARAGAISASLIEVFDAIAADAPTLDLCVAALGAIGHSSGWDCLAGLTAVAVALKEPSD